MQVQISARENAELLSAEFQRRYEPNFAWGNICSNYLSLPGLRSFWPGSAHRVDANGFYLTDIANGFDCTGSVGFVPSIRYGGLIPYVYYQVGSSFQRAADEAHFDILGNEAYIANPGLTLGCWFTCTGNAATRHLITKWAGAGQQSYRLYHSDIGGVTSLSVNGGAATVSSTYIIPNNGWRFVAARFVPSTTVDIYMSSSVIGEIQKLSSAAGVPATLTNSNAVFALATDTSGINVTHLGNMTLDFICASALTDTQIYSLFHQSRPLFGR